MKWEEKNNNAVHIEFMAVISLMTVQSSVSKNIFTTAPIPDPGQNFQIPWRSLKSQIHAVNNE